MKRDYYEVLGISRTASKDEIKNAYRKLALQYHPDRNKLPGAEERFKEISEAYAVLSDDEKRRQYDSLGREDFSQRYTEEDLFRGADFESIFRDMGFGLDFDFFHMFDRGREGPARGRDIAYEIEITPAEAASGTRKEMKFLRTEQCDVCRGTGATPGTMPRRCPQCGGRGQVQSVRREGTSTFVQVATCPSCGGRGAIIDSPCSRCGGAGTVRRKRTITFRIPARTYDGCQLRFKGQGNALPNGATGDLYVLIRVSRWR